MFRVQVPFQLRTDMEGYRFLSNLYLSVLGQEEKEICVDFLQCEDIDANLFAAFGAMLEKLMKDFQCSINVRRPKNGILAQKLLKSHFSVYWDSDNRIEYEEDYVGYNKFDNTNSTQFKEYIRSELLGKQGFPKHTEPVGDEIIGNIFEIYVNAVTHGDTNFVYICGEYKKVENVLEMSIVNLGRTIPYNVNEFMGKRGQEQKSPCAAIEWAFGSGNTTKEDTGGLGLALLKEFIEKNEGNIQLVSGGGMIEYKGGQLMPFPLDFEFPGTIVKMKFNFADTKEYFLRSEIIDENNIL